MNYYAMMIFLGFIVGSIFIYYFLKKEKYRFFEIFIFISLVFSSSVFGAKLYYYFTNFAILKNNFNIIKLGFSSYGALIGIIASIALFSFLLHKKKLPLINLCAIVCPLIYGISKIGCAIVGCCYGIKYNGLGHIVYNHSLIAPNNTGLFPIQIVESILFIGIFFFLFIFNKKNENKIKNIGISLIICSMTKILLEYLRYSHHGAIISYSQIVGILIFIIGILLVKFNNYLKNKIDK